MKKHILPRLVIGFMGGISVEMLVVLSISLAQGQLMLFTPAFLGLCVDNEILAYGMQHFLVGLIGVAFAEASICFQVERWSFLRQYLTFYLITTGVWVPVSLICWFPQNRGGVLSLMISFFSTYLINWVIQLAVSRNNVKKLNRLLRESRSGREKP